METKLAPKKKKKRESWYMPKAYEATASYLSETYLNMSFRIRSLYEYIT